MSLAEDHERRQQRMKLRMAAMFAVVAIGVVFVIWYQRRERAASATTTTEPSAPSTGSSSAPTTPNTPAGGSGERVRKIDKRARETILEAIQTVRKARESGGPTGAASTPKRPELPPALPGTLTKDQIQTGVRAVIPLLAQCYRSAQARLPNKEGKIIVLMHLTGEPEIGTLIESAEIEGDAHFTSDAAMVECFQETMLSVELPPIAEGGTIDVTYPIAFSPG